MSGSAESTEFDTADSERSNGDDDLHSALSDFGSPSHDDDDDDDDPLGVFGKYLSIWVLLCMIVGTLIGYYAPVVAATLQQATFYNIDTPTAILIWLMIYPMMMQVRLSAILDVRRRIGGVLVCTVMNWAVQPFVMYGLAVLFFKVAYVSLIDAATQDQYIAGSVLLGSSPCTAMVFVWSKLAGGDAAYTVVQVAVNDVILLFAYVPLVVGLLALSSIEMPWATVIVSVVLFVVTPFIAGGVTRFIVLRRFGVRAFERLTALLNYVTMAALLLTLVIIFIFQGQTIVEQWLHILLIAVPLTLQTFVSFGMAYGACYAVGLDYEVSAPAGFIGSSNFFELAVSVAVTVFGAQSGAAAATVVGVLTEVPTMLALVWFAKRTRHAFERRAASAPLRRLRQWVAQRRGAAHTSLLPAVAAFADKCATQARRRESLPAERCAAMERVARCIASMLESGDDERAAQLLFLCTHNSRRSQLAQVWFAVAAEHYGLALETSSAGTDATTVHPSVIRALESAGLQVDVEPHDDGAQPIFLVHYSRLAPPLRCFSKTLAQATTPDDGTLLLERTRCIVAVCSDADQQCPIGGACKCRLALPYADPKSSDGTDAEAQVYGARSREIALEAFWIASRVATYLKETPN